jgi:hypothetical protein
MCMTWNKTWELEKSGTDKELKESYEKPTVLLDTKRKGFVWLRHIIWKGWTVVIMNTTFLKLYQKI